MTAREQTVARRPGGRSARVRDAVYAAVGQLVGQGGRETLTIPQVAERAGVNPTSIYRRWGTIDALVEEVAVAALTRDEPLPDTGDLRRDLRDWARVIAADIGRPARVVYLQAMAAARGPDAAVCPCWDLRCGQAADMVQRARDRGEDAPTARQILDHVIAPLYHHAIYGLPTDAAYADLLVSDVLSMRGERGTAR